MLGSRPQVALRHCPTLASIESIVAERLPKIIDEQLFEPGIRAGARGSPAEAKKLIDEKFLVLHGSGSGDGWHDWLGVMA